MMLYMKEKTQIKKNYKLVDLLDADVNNFTTDSGMAVRRVIAKPLKKVLNIATVEDIIIDRYPHLNSKESYIFASTHGFSDDIISCLATIDRSAYLLLGSTDQIEHNKLMYAAWLNGFIYVDRTDEKSRKDAIPKMERVLNNGSSVLIFPEGGFNNTENSLCNKLFAGPYILAKETGCKVVPIAPFYEYGSSKIYMQFGDPIDLAKYDDKKEALIYLRDVFATMVYNNIELHATPFERLDNRDIHMDFMEQRRQEYLKNSWTKDIWDEELTRYLDMNEREYAAAMESMDNVHVDEKNAAIMGPMLVKRQEQKKYDFKNYMHENWNKDI
jgi:hypothetical protein